MLNWISRFMAGRYGFDRLGQVLAITAAAVLIFARIFASGVLALIAYVLAAECIYRMLSKRIVLRTNENRKFSQLCAAAGAFMRRDRKKYKYFRCPKCRSTVKVPRGKGKIAIRCRFCGDEFIRKS